MLRALMAAMFLGLTGWFVWMLVMPPSDPGDRLMARDWLIPAGFVVMLGGPYLYVSASLTVDRTHVRVLNPLRQAEIPLGHIREVVAGSNMRIATDYGRFYAWGVEAANAQVAGKSYGTQGGLVDLITDAAKQATNGSEPPARYHFRAPDLIFLTASSALIACSVYMKVSL